MLLLLCCSFNESYLRRLSRDPQISILSAFNLKPFLGFLSAAVVDQKSTFISCIFKQLVLDSIRGF